MILRVLVLLLLCSCGAKPWLTRWWTPIGRGFSYEPITDDEVYKLAWRDGCQSGMATGFGKNVNMVFHHYRKDPRFTEELPDEEHRYFNGKKITKADRTKYKNVWANTLFACRHMTINQWQPDRKPELQSSPIYLDSPTTIYEFKDIGMGAEGNFAFW